MTYILILSQQVCIGKIFVVCPNLSTSYLYLTPSSNQTVHVHISVKAQRARKLQLYISRNIDRKYAASSSTQLQIEIYTVWRHRAWDNPKHIHLSGIIDPNNHNIGFRNLCICVPITIYISRISAEVLGLWHLEILPLYLVSPGKRLKVTQNFINYIFQIK